MIPCKFVYKFSSGGSSDSLNQTYDVHAVPKVGDTVSLFGDDGASTTHTVLDVHHVIYTGSNGGHEITVYYGQAS